MLKKKVVVGKNRTVVSSKKTSDRYLRGDINCGLVECTVCSKNNSNLMSVGSDVPYVIIPSVKSWLENFNFFLDESVRNVVLLQTVSDYLSERNLNAELDRSLGVFKSNKNNKRVHYFYNEFHSEIYSSLLADEKAEERNLRIFCKASLWYCRHNAFLLADNSVNFYAVFADVEELRACEKYLKSEQSELRMCTVDDFYDLNFADNQALGEKLQMRSFFEDETNKEHLYEEHWSAARAEKGLSDGEIHMGVLNVDPDNYNQAFVECEKQRFFISSRFNMNRAIDKDVVYIRVIDETLQPAKFILREEQDVIVNFTSNENEFVNGRVVCIKSRKHKKYVGSILSSALTNNFSKVVFRPLNRSIPHIYIYARNASFLQGQRLVVSIDKWSIDSKYPEGHYVSSLGQANDKQTETLAILIDNNISYLNFSSLVMDCLPEFLKNLRGAYLFEHSTEKVCNDTMLGEIFSSEKFTNEYKRFVDEKMAAQSYRRDLRGLNVLSVDPPGCTDIDDALSVEHNDSGEIKIGVHIADASEYILINTELDREASMRGTTVYLADRRIDMIPAELSSHLCSLKEGQDRLAFSVFFTFDGEHNLIKNKTFFCKSLIRSRAALTYEKAQDIVDNHKDNLLHADLSLLQKISKKLRDARLKKGALILASNEIKFEVDSETADPVNLVSKKTLEMNRTIEDWMLLANTTVAEQIYSFNKSNALLRRHPKPDSENAFASLIDLLRNRCNMSDEFINKNKLNLNNLISRACELVEQHNLDEYVPTLIRQLATRCLKQAVYFNSNDVTDDEFYHYGLAESIYTHFTSPIRRYADVMVHRMLFSSLVFDSNVSYDLTELTNHLNRKTRAARMAAFASIKLHTTIFIKQQMNGVADVYGYVTDLKKNAIKVYIVKFGREGKLFLKNELVDSVELKNCDSEMVINRTATLRKLDRLRLRMTVVTNQLYALDKLVYSLLEPECYAPFF